MPQSIIKKVKIYTDGACSGNPGPGGYGVILEYGEKRRELSGGEAQTTNNRMELLAAIRGLEVLKEDCGVELFSDSRYLVDGIKKGWAARWQKNGWMRNAKEPAKNADLWERLMELCARHTVNFIWVRGHADNENNNRCDALAVTAAKNVAGSNTERDADE